MSLDVAPHASHTQQHPIPAPRPQQGPQQQSPPADQPLVIGSNVSLTGILRVDGEVWIEGRIEADVRCQILLVAPGAHIDGVIVADRVEIYGVVQGEIYCNRAIVKDNSRVEAELYYRSLELEPGGFFEGRSRRHADPMNLSPNFG